jgi:hypothetical protein
MSDPAHPPSADMQKLLEELEAAMIDDEHIRVFPSEYQARLAALPKLVTYIRTLEKEHREMRTLLGGISSSPIISPRDSLAIKNVLSSLTIK